MFMLFISDHGDCPFLKQSDKRIKLFLVLLLYSFLGERVNTWHPRSLPILLETDDHLVHLLFADYCSPRAEVLSLDWRLHSGLSLHLPANVDQQAWVRWSRPLHCPQEVLLKSEWVLWGSLWGRYYQSWSIKICKTYFSVEVFFSQAFMHTMLRAFHTLFLIHTVSLWDSNSIIPILQMRKMRLREV